MTPEQAPQKTPRPVKSHGMKARRSNAKTSYTPSSHNSSENSPRPRQRTQIGAFESLQANLGNRDYRFLASQPRAGSSQWTAPPPSRPRTPQHEMATPGLSHFLVAHGELLDLAEDLLHKHETSLAEQRQTLSAMQSQYQELLAANVMPEHNGRQQHTNYSCDAAPATLQPCMQTTQSLRGVKRVHQSVGESTSVIPTRRPHDSDSESRETGEVSYTQSLPHKRSRQDIPIIPDSDGQDKDSDILPPARFRNYLTEAQEEEEEESEPESEEDDTGSM